MAVVLVIVVFAIICIRVIPGLIKKTYFRELYVFIGFMVPEFIVAVLIALNVKLPRPTEGIGFVVQHMLKFIGSTLGM